MKSKIFTIALAASAAAALSLPSCNPSPASDTTGDLISFRNIEFAAAYTYVNSASSYDADSDVVVACKAELLMPVNVLRADISSLQDSILRQAFVIPEATIANVDSCAEAFFHTRCSEDGFELNARVIHPDSIDDFYTRYNGYVTVDINPVTLTENVLAMQTIRGQYEPYAAHGMYSIWYVNYDIKRGRIISLSDILTPDGIAALPKILKRQARAMSTYLGPMQLDGLPADNNFYINARNELVFAYQPYEIASFSQGEIRIPIPAYRLSEYLTPEGLSLLF